MASKVPLAPNSHFILSINKDKKDVTLSTGFPDVEKNQVALFLPSDIDMSNRSVIVFTIEVVRRFIMGLLTTSRGFDTTIFYSCPIGGAISHAVEGSGTPDSVIVYVGGDILATGNSHALNETFNQLISAFLEASKGN